MAVHDILFRLVRDLISSGQWPGVKPPAIDPAIS